MICPYGDQNYHCTFPLQDREIRQLSSDIVYQKHLKRSILTAEKSGTEKSFHCKTKNCDGWCILADQNVRDFRCPVCTYTNCIPCEAIHSGYTCEQYSYIRANNSLEQFGVQATDQYLQV